METRTEVQKPSASSNVTHKLTNVKSEHRSFIVFQGLRGERGREGPPGPDGKAVSTHSDFHQHAFKRKLSAHQRPLMLLSLMEGKDGTPGEAGPVGSPGKKVRQNVETVFASRDTTFLIVSRVNAVQQDPEESPVPKVIR